MSTVRLLALALAAVAASSAAAASTASCDLATLVPLLVDERNDACFAASGIAFPPPPSAAPTAEQWPLTCAVEACLSFYSDLLDATPTDCAIGVYAAHADLVNQHRVACGFPLLDDVASQSSAASASSGSLDHDAVRTEDLLTPEPTTPEPTTAAPKRNTTVVVEALTNAAPSLLASSSLAVAVSIIASTIATLAL